MKKEIEICDVCDERVAKKTCSVCLKDVCSYCGKDWRVLVGVGNEITIPFCKACSRQKIDKDTLEEIKKAIIDKIKKGRIVENLTERGKDER